MEQMVAAVIVPSLQELLSAAIQSYLYHRKIYPESVFESRYFSGIQVFLSREDALTEYIASHLLLRAETAGSLEKEASEFVAKFVVNVEEPKQGDTVERLTFAFAPARPDSVLDEEYVVQTIQTLLIHISNVPRRLGPLPDSCSFTLLSYPRQRETEFTGPMHTPEGWMACGSRTGHSLPRILPLEPITLPAEKLRIECYIETLPAPE